MAYDERYRKRAVEYRKEGHTQEATAKVFKIGVTTLKQWEKKYNETGEIKNKPLNRTHKKIPPKELEKFVEEHPDAYLEEIAAAFGCVESAVRQALKKHKITRKKRPNATRSKTPRK